MLGSISPSEAAINTSKISEKVSGFFSKEKEKPKTIEDVQILSSLTLYGNIDKGSISQIWELGATSLLSPGLAGMRYTLTLNPFGNCQIATFGYVESLINAINSFPKEISRKLFLRILTEIWFFVSKRMVLIDVNRAIADYIVTLAKDCIQWKQPYTSSNGSERTFILLRLDSAYSILESMYPEGYEKAVNFKK